MTDALDLSLTGPDLYPNHDVAAYEAAIRPANRERASSLVTLEDGTRALVYVSPSAIKTFLECPRKWFYAYVLGQRPPSTPAQMLGTSIHAEAEAWGAR